MRAALEPEQSHGFRIHHRRLREATLMKWIIPSLGYVVLVGSLGITTKYAFRALKWQELIVWTALAYGAAAVVLLLLGSPLSLHGGVDGAMIIISSLIPPVGLGLFFIALRNGDASRVVPVTSVYPVITALLSVLVLSEQPTWTMGAGVLLVVGGVILLSL